MEHEFFTKNMSATPIGRSKRRPEGMEHAASIGNKLLYHCELGSNATDRFPKGLSTTKFHRGFDRRKQDSISNIFSEKEREYAVIREARVTSLVKARAEKIYSDERSHGYNIISGVPYGNVEITSDKPRKVSLGNGLSDAAIRTAEISLRESPARYFVSPANEEIRRVREGRLLREGLLKDKKTGSLAGKSDLPSYGVEDQFGKSQ